MLFLSTLSLRRATFEYIQAGTGILFLSTLSLRRATVNGVGLLSYFGNFYPRSPCGERPPLTSRTKSIAAISIHALLAESDFLNKSKHYSPSPFLSTLSLRRATSVSSVINNVINDFYPRSPCGERRALAYLAGFVYLFLSTLSLRRATADMRQRLIKFGFLSTLSLRRATVASNGATKSAQISIHALLAESDNILCVVSVQVGGFLSTLSLRRATI